jgi:FtsZ-interacting cell division protein YlmF
MPDEVAAPGDATTAADAAKVEDPNAQTTETPAEVTEPFSFEDEPAITPQSLNDMLQGDEAIKAAVEANPKVKNALHKLARENAELVQFKGIYPNADSARFAKQTADRTVSLRMQFQRAETPELMATAYDSFMQEFAVVDAAGKPVLDAQGQPTYGDDFYALNEHIIERYSDNTGAEVEARLAANKYATPAERQRDEDLKIAIDIIKEDLKGSYGEAKPDLSQYPEEIRSDIQKKLDDIERREAALNGKRTEAQKIEHQQKVTQANQQYMTDIARRTYDGIQEIVKEFRNKGALLPDWQLLAAAPGSKTPIFYQNVANEMEKLIKADAYTFQNFLELEAKPPTPENTKARVEFFDRLLKDNLRTIVKTQVRGFGKQQVEAAAAKPEPTTTASVEPRSQAAPTPKILTKDEAYAQAKANLVKTDRDFGNLSEAEQLAKVMTAANRLLNSR